MILIFTHMFILCSYLASKPAQPGHGNIPSANLLLEFRFLLKLHMRWWPGRYELKWCIVCGSIHRGIVFVS